MNRDKEKILKIINKEYIRSSSKGVNGRKVSLSIPKIYEEIFHDCISIKTFSETIEKLIETKFIHSVQKNILQRKILQGLLRFSFFCQPVNTKNTTTIFKTRWEISQNDSRYSDYDNCFAIFTFYSDIILKKLKNFTEIEYSSLKNYINYAACPYDIPLDYKNLTKKKIHLKENIEFIEPTTFQKGLDKRNLLFSILKKTLPKRILDKIKVSAYKTERRQTGLFNTNREYRWETVSGSPQGAKKRDCWEVELKLMEQIVCMTNFPKRYSEKLSYLKDKKTLCPITLEPLNFRNLLAEGNKSIHGESAIQLGHLTPKSNEPGAHTADNITWISNRGNRLQGNETVKAIHSLILKIAKKLSERDS